jgi:glycosyltransferase involved in cell wall biosynthesis
MRIAWLGKKSPFCGNVTYCREITNALLDRGHSIDFLHFTDESEVSGYSQDFHNNNSSYNNHNSQEVSLPFLYKSTIYTLPSPRSSKVLIESLRNLKPDLVHASLALSPLDFLLPEICADLNLPLVATFHPPFDIKKRNITSSTQQLTYQIYAPTLAEYNQVIVFSQIQRSLLYKLGVPEKRIAVIPNGVDPEKFSPGYSTIKQELKAERLYVYQGRLAAEKNVESLLSAWRKLKMPSNCKLAIVGDGPNGAALRSSYGSEEGVIWMGYIADEQRRIEILRGADVFILPSLVEGLSLSLLEAMSCGVACLATDVGADGEVLANGAGIVLDPRKVITQLCTLLPLFALHPEMIDVLGRKARQRVLEQYNLNANITQLEKMYTQVLHQQKVRLRF